jgi:hypothetical protein
VTVADPRADTITRQPAQVLTPEERLALSQALETLGLVDEDELVDLATAAIGWFEDWLLHRDGARAPSLDETVNALVKVITDLRTRLAWVEAGADFTPMPEHLNASDAQVWASLLQSRPEHRLVRLEAAARQSRAGLNCFLHHHEDRLEQLTARCTRLERLVRDLGGDPDA